MNDVDFANHIENMLRDSDIADESDTIDDSDADLVCVSRKMNMEVTLKIGKRISMPLVCLNSLLINHRYLKQIINFQ